MKKKTQDSRTSYT